MSKGWKMAGLVLFMCLQLSTVSQASLAVVDEQGKTHTVSTADLAKLPRRTVTTSKRPNMKAFNFPTCSSIAVFHWARNYAGHGSLTSY